MANVMDGGFLRDSSTHALVITGFAGVANTFTAAQTFSPTATGANGVTVNVPNLTDNSIYGLVVADAVGGAGALLHIDHYGAATGSGGNPGIGLDVMNRAGSTGLAVAVHGYTNSNLVQFDNTGSGSMLKLVNTENPTNNPGSHGTGPYLDIQGYKTTTTRAVGVVTGTNTLTDTITPAAFTAADVGKAITVAAVSTTIATVVSATQITTASSSLVNGSGVTYSYQQASDVAQIGVLTAGLVWGSYGTNPWTFKSTNAETVGLRVDQPTGGGSGAYGAYVIQASATSALKVDQNGASDGVVVSQFGVGSGLSVSQGASSGTNYAIKAQGLAYGLNATSSANSGLTVNITKNGTGNGSALYVNNKGTGPTLDLQNTGTASFTLTPTGTDGNLLAVGTTTGLKIGTATTQKLGFFNATPIVQPARPTDAASIITAGTALGIWA